MFMHRPGRKATHALMGPSLSGKSGACQEGFTYVSIYIFKHPSSHLLTLKAVVWTGHSILG
jgi:hypothetical protein